jgi:ABC-type proline/glycine betaine transport system permease subunit
MIGSLLVEHIILSVLPVSHCLDRFAAARLLVFKTKRVANVILAFLGVIYSIPSLALFVMMPLILGTKILNPVNIVAALAIYFDCTTGAQRRGRPALGVSVGEAVRLSSRLRLATHGCSGLSCRSPCR